MSGSSSHHKGNRRNPSSLPYFIWLASSIFGILGSVILQVGDGQAIVLDAVLGRIPGYESDFNPYCHLQDLGLWALVDTGAFSFQLIWKEWYDSALGPGSRANFFAGCFTCRTTCDPRHAEIYVNTFLDGTTVKIIEHQENIKIGSVDVGETEFELIIGHDPPPEQSPVFNLMGLGRTSQGSLTPLLYQLVNKRPKIVNRRTFAVYFNQKVPNKDMYRGKVLLGGGDPNRYKHPLNYLKFTDEIHYMVPLNSMQVGDGHLHIGINQNILLDSGSSALAVPQLYFDAIMREISQTVGQPLVWDPLGKLWTIACRYYASMPKLILNLGPRGEVPITMNNINYVRPDNKWQKCWIMILKQDISYWILPGSALIGYYFEFQIDNGQVGIARTQGASLHGFNGSELPRTFNEAKLYI